MRLCEWSHVRHGLGINARRDIATAVNAWRVSNCLLDDPFSFRGPDGDELWARQYVGVVEVNDATIEIYPKLDAELITSSDDMPLASSVQTGSVMQNLLWMLHVSGYVDVVETDAAHLEESSASFFDLFAYLLGKNLLAELERGVAHSYVTCDGDLKMVRGRINYQDQLTRNWNRFDRVSCVWDEFTPNSAINRLFKCACRFLGERVTFRKAGRLLLDCQTWLDEVEDVSPSAALRDVRNLRFDRSMERFKKTFELAQRLLAGIGHNLAAGSAKSFVFLLDMNEVFQSYVHAVLETHFKAPVSEQEDIGSLLRVARDSIRQIPDFQWRARDEHWIGDAKYKHLAKGQQRALRFVSSCELGEPAEGSEVAGKVLSPADVRQITVYAELARLKYNMEKPPNLMLLYPFVGDAAACMADSVITWNGSTLWLTPVQVKSQDFLGNAIRFPAAE